MNCIVRCHDLDQLTELYEFYDRKRESWMTWLFVLIVDDECKGPWDKSISLERYGDIDIENLQFSTWKHRKKRGVVLAETLGML